MDKPIYLKTILFDLDGTLINLDIDWGELQQSIFKIIGRTIPFQDAYMAANKQTKIRLSQALESLEIKGAHTSKTTAGAKKIFGILQTKYNLAVVTRNSRRSVEIALKKHFKNLPLIVAREDVDMLKPHPECLYKAMRQLSTLPTETILVGDTSHDVEAGQAAGIQVVVVKNTNLDYTPKNADFYVESLNDLLGLSVFF